MDTDEKAPVHVQASCDCGWSGNWADAVCEEKAVKNSVEFTYSCPNCKKVGVRIHYPNIDESKERYVFRY